MDLGVEIAIMGVVATIVFGVLGCVPGYISAYYAKKDHDKKTQDSVTQEVQIDDPFYDRFTRAIDQLGSEKLEIRLGGIYALERIANESEKDYWSIMEILTAYARKNSPVEMSESQENVSLDIQAIINVIGRRNYKEYESIQCIDPLREYKHLDLSHTCLNRADFHGAHFEGVYFVESHLKGVNFEKSHLQGANFGEAHLDGSFFGEAHLEGTYFGNAHLEKAFFVSPALKGAHFVWTMFDRAYLKEAHFETTHVSSAIFDGACLKGAHFEEANFKEIHVELTSPKGKSVKTIGDLFIFKGAHLEEANFEGSKNLTIEQLSKAKTLYNANIDGELEKPLKALTAS